MLPLLARKRSGKSRWRQERFVNKSPRPAVIEGYMRWRSVHGHGREAVGMLRACVRSRLVTLMVAIASLWLLGWPEGRGGADELRARSEVQPADLDRARDRHAPE